VFVNDSNKSDRERKISKFHAFMNFILKKRKNGISNNDTALIFDVFQSHWLKQPKGFLIKSVELIWWKCSF